jgi:ABC-type Na+ efflux pump permease subunit
MALLILQGPWLLAVFAAVRAAAVAQNAVAGEAARGGLELLLASPHRLSQIFAGMLISSLALTLLGWVVMALTVLGPSAATLALLHVRFMLPVSHFLPLVFLPVPMVLWANLIALLLVLRFPQLAQIRAGTSGSVVQLVAASPTIAFFAAISLRPEADALRVGLLATAVGIAGCGVAAAVLKRHFRAERFLES